MVTNPILYHNIGFNTLITRLKDKEVNLNSVVNGINSARMLKGNHARLMMKDVIRSSSFVDMVLATERRLGIRAANDYSVPDMRLHADGRSRGALPRVIESPLVRTSRSNTAAGGTWVHPYIAIDVATHYDKDFAVAVYEVLVDSPIFSFRENGGDMYKGLMAVLAEAYKHEGRIPAKMRIIARIIAARCGVEIDLDGNTWNTVTVEQANNRIQMMQFIGNTLTGYLAQGILPSFMSVCEYAASASVFMHPEIKAVDIADIIKTDLSYIIPAEQMLGIAA